MRALWERVAQIFPAPSRVRIFAIILFVVLNALVLLSEIPMIAPAELQGFVLIKCIVIFSAIPIGVLIYCFPKNSLLNYVMGIPFFAINFASFFYRPLYTIGMFENLFVFCFAFVLVDWIFVLYAILCFSALAVAHQMLWPNIPDAYAKLELIDYQQFNVQFAAILIFFYFFFVRARRYRMETERKLSLIGKNASNIAHDLKGMIMGPQLYLNRLMELVGQDKKASVEIKELLELLTTQFGELERMMATFNQLCLVDKTIITKFSAAETARAASAILWKLSNGVEIKIEGDMQIEGERAVFLSLCFNLMTNSLHAIHESRNGAGLISWKFDERRKEIICQDNGGGFSAKALESIKAETPFSSKENGTGLGIPLVIQSAAQLNGVVKFANHDSGAMVKIRFH